MIATEDDLPRWAAWSRTFTKYGLVISAASIPNRPPPCKPAIYATTVIIANFDDVPGEDYFPVHMPVRNVTFPRVRKFPDPGATGTFSLPWWFCTGEHTPAKDDPRYPAMVLRDDSYAFFPIVWTGLFWSPTLGYRSGSVHAVAPYWEDVTVGPYTHCSTVPNNRYYVED